MFGFIFPWDVWVSAENWTLDSSRIAGFMLILSYICFSHLILRCLDKPCNKRSWGQTPFRELVKHHRFQYPLSNISANIVSTFLISNGERVTKFIFILSSLNFHLSLLSVNAWLYVFDILLCSVFHFVIIFLGGMNPGFYFVIVFMGSMNTF